MKIYIVLDNFLRQTKVWKVFDSREKAQNYIEKHKWKEILFIKPFNLE